MLLWDELITEAGGYSLRGEYIDTRPPVPVNAAKSSAIDNDNDRSPSNEPVDNKLSDVNDPGDNPAPGLSCDVAYSSMLADLSSIIDSDRFTNDKQSQSARYVIHE